MNITKHDIDPLNLEITIDVTPADYEEKVNEGIKKVQRQASMPGFRPGKVPAGLIRKQYGSQIMADELNKLLNDSIYKYIQDNKLEILGNPLPKDNNRVNVDQQQEFSFVYELGLAPEFSISLDKGLHFDQKMVKVDDELVEKYVKDVRRNYGRPSQPEVAEERDVMFVDIVELDADGSIKPAGVFKSTTVSPERVKNESARKKLIGLKREDKLVVNVNDLFETDVDKGVSLGMDKELAKDADFNIQLTVKNISRMEDAPLDQELFDRIYGQDNVTSEEAFRNKIREELAMMFLRDSDRFLIKEIENKLVSQTDMKLPDEFLKRWIIASNEKPVTMEEVEKEYPEYAKAMKWRLIENKIIRDNSIEVTGDEVKQEAQNYIRSEYARYGQQPTDEDLERISKDLLKNEKEAQKIVESLHSRKVLALIKEKCTLDAKEVSYDDFFKNN